MTTVGSYEAKTRLPELLRYVEQGQSVTITRRGVPIAKIVGVETQVRDGISKLIRRIRNDRARRPSVSVEELLAARDEGRSR